MAWLAKPAHREQDDGAGRDSVVRAVDGGAVTASRMRPVVAARTMRAVTVSPAGAMTGRALTGRSGGLFTREIAGTKQQ